MGKPARTDGKRKQLQDEQHRLYHELSCQRKHLESERRRLDADFRHVQGLLDEVKAFDLLAADAAVALARPRAEGDGVDPQVRI